MLKGQGDEPHPDKNPRMKMNATNKPCGLIIRAIPDRYKALEEVLTKIIQTSFIL